MMSWWESKFVKDECIMGNPEVCSVCYISMVLLRQVEKLIADIHMLWSYPIIDRFEVSAYSLVFFPDVVRLTSKRSFSPFAISKNRGFLTIRPFDSRKQHSGLSGYTFLIHIYISFVEAHNLTVKPPISCHDSGIVHHGGGELPYADL